MKKLLLIITLLGFNLAQAGLKLGQKYKGVNKYDLFTQYLGARGTLQPKEIGLKNIDKIRVQSRTEAKVAIESASAIGAQFIRVSLSGLHPYWKHNSESIEYPSDLKLWQVDREKYWKIFKEMMIDFQKFDIYLVPVFLWSPEQFPVMTGETIRDLIVNPESKSYKLAIEFISDAIHRFKTLEVNGEFIQNRILFYEITNELNLRADLDLLSRCINYPAWEENQCSAQSHFSTDEMVDFLRRVSNIIRNIDSEKPISSGHSMPSPVAYSRSQNPEFQDPDAKNNFDSFDQFKDYLAKINKDVDLISVHFYNGNLHDIIRFNDFSNSSFSNPFTISSSFLFPKSKRPLRSRSAQKMNYRYNWISNVNLLNIVGDIAKGLNKQVFVGEFNGAYEDSEIKDSSLLNDIKNENHNFFNNVMRLFRKHESIIAVAPWALDHFGPMPYQTDKLSFGLNNNQERTLIFSEKYDSLKNSEVKSNDFLKELNAERKTRPFLSAPNFSNNFTYFLWPSIQEGVGFNSELNPINRRPWMSPVQKSELFESLKNGQKIVVRSVDFENEVGTVRIIVKGSSFSLYWEILDTFYVEGKNGIFGLTLPYDKKWQEWKSKYGALQISATPIKKDSNLELNIPITLPALLMD